VAAQIPHFAFPFRFTDSGRAAVVDQDSSDDVAGCVAAVLCYPLGARADAPTFGVPDQAFRTNGVNTEEVRQALAEWEPRADTVFVLDDDLLALGIQDVSVFLVRGEQA
jgi:phage baseplate assembly protein W